MNHYEDSQTTYSFEVPIFKVDSIKVATRLDANQKAFINHLMQYIATEDRFRIVEEWNVITVDAGSEEQNARIELFENAVKIKYCVSAGNCDSLALEATYVSGWDDERDYSAVWTVEYEN